MKTGEKPSLMVREQLGKFGKSSPPVTAKGFTKLSKRSTGHLLQAKADNAEMK